MTGGNKRELAKAYHEAGHAVMARRLGIAVIYATMLSTDDTNAAAALTQRAAWFARDADQATLLSAIEKDIKICLAGPYAQSRHRPRKSGRNPDEWRDDIENASGLVAEIVLNERGAMPPVGEIVTLDPDGATRAKCIFDRLAEETDAVVEENWPAITRVAEALLIRRILIGDDVDELIAGRLPVASLPPMGFPNRRAF
jgi:hypothetical protein